MIEPFFADFHAGAVTHRLFHEVAGTIREHSVKPYQYLSLGLVPVLGLTIDRPAKKPAGILDRDNAARDHLSGQRITLADLPDVGQDLLVQGIDRGADPVAVLRVGAEFVGASKGGILGRNLPPEAERTAFVNFAVHAGSFGLTAVGGVFHITAVGVED